MNYILCIYSILIVKWVIQTIRIFAHYTIQTPNLIFTTHAHIHTRAHIHTHTRTYIHARTHNSLHIGSRADSHTLMHIHRYVQ